MNKNNLIRFAQSLVLLPFMAGTLPFGNIPKVSPIATEETTQIVFAQKENIGEAEGILAFNQALDQKAKDLKIKAEAIDSYFKSRSMPLFGMGMKMAEEAEKNNLDWRLLPAIAFRESTGGKYGCVKVKHNPFGWGSCKIGFDSYEEAVETVAKNLGGNNPKTARHYADKNTEEILKAYNPPSIIPNYVKQVKAIMDDIGEENIIPDTPMSSYVL